MDGRFTEFTKKYVSTMLEVNPHLSEPSDRDNKDEIIIDVSHLFKPKKIT